MAVLLAVAGSCFVACSTHRVPLGYVATRALEPPASAAPTVTVGRFADERRTDSDWLGAIRGGYGKRSQETPHRVPHP